MLKATKMQTTGYGVLKQNPFLRTLTGSCSCSLSGWWYWTTSSATLVSSSGWTCGLCLAAVSHRADMEACLQSLVSEYPVRMSFE